MWQPNILLTNDSASLMLEMLRGIATLGSFCLVDAGVHPMRAPAHAPSMSFLHLLVLHHTEP